MPGPDTTGGPGDTTQGAPTTGNPSTISDTGSGGASESDGTTDTTTTTGPATTTTDTGDTTDTTTGTVTTTPVDTTGDTTTQADTDTGDSTTGEPEFCAGEGGILLPGDGDKCSGDLGKNIFTFALCSCTNFTTAGIFTVDAFNSDANMPQPLHGGSVGINGNYTTVALADIGGTLWVDGKVSTVAVHEVGEILQCGGDVSATVLSHVNDDAFVEGNIGGLLPLMTIDGDLHQPVGKVNAGANVLGQTIKGPVSVDTPCDCSDPIDIAGIVDGYAQDNDNEAAGIDADELADVILPKVIELPCGVYYFNDIEHLLALKIKLTGRTVIAVKGDLTSIGLFDIELGPDAELDLFITGNASFADLATLGDTERPAAFRMYVGGVVSFVSLFTFGGNLYQPNAVFNAGGLASIWGSLFVGGINLVGAFAIHYDEAILDIDGCEPPGGSCFDGDDCGNPTPKCKQGECVPCETNADCGPPLTCQPGGVCYPLPG
ncbi:DUF7305 domain-containing protein [Nannocystis bainbridge]|uniref:DUF7305 domain-containing protein n=1 Tax=Nannocystis bainbridge TaxID=2995303 RepID=A0ABT5DS20_9BACT|nr:hypothetical protein [Nannocystis bainbridge]MDC0715933.1 hypothetical protein [Nannocystis bainbridge]